MNPREAHPAMNYLTRRDGGSYQYLIGPPGSGKSFAANAHVLVPALRAGLPVTVIDATTGFRCAAEHFGVVVTSQTIAQATRWTTAPLAVLELEALLYQEAYIREGWKRAARQLELRMQFGGILIVDEVQFVLRVTRDSTHPLGPLVKRFLKQGNVKLLFIGQVESELGELMSIFPPKHGDSFVKLSRITR